MGSAPSEAVIRDLEREAYSALLRASAEGFLLQARTQLNINNDVAQEILMAARTDLELIKSGRRPVGISGKFTSAGSLPAGPRPSRKRDRSALQRSSPAAPPPAPLREPSYGLAVEEDISSDESFRKTRVKPQKQKKQTQRPIGAPGSSRPRGRPSGGIVGTPVGVGGGGAGPSRPAVARQPSLARPRSTRSMGSVDPHNLVGRRIWRYYPNEDPERPWVEGFIFEYDPDTGTHRILYDPNDPDRQESVEQGFNINVANASEYVLGDYFELESCFGSRRQRDRPAQVSIVPAAAVVAPAKRRRSASIKIPQGVPFPTNWLETAVLEATPDDLHTMLNMLENREAQLVIALEEAEMALLMGEDLEKRAKLEQEFEELCRREARVMADLTAIRDAEQ